MTDVADAAFAWDVILPERRASPIRRGVSPRATLIMRDDANGEKRVVLPVAVGRALRRVKVGGAGGPATPEELLALLDQLMGRCAGERIAALLNRRDYSAWEVRERLARDGYASQLCDDAVACAVACGLVDDQRYADALIRTRVSGGWGRQRIEQELRRRGIDSSMLAGWPQDYLSGDEEEARALALARTRRIAERNGYEKLVRYLVGRGYPLALSMRVARRIIDEAAE